MSFQWTTVLFFMKSIKKKVPRARGQGVGEGVAVENGEWDWA